MRYPEDASQLRMNVKKTKTMVLCRDEIPDVRIVVNGQVLEEVKKFKYLSQWITDDGRCECEIKNRIEIGQKHIYGDERCVDITEITFRDQKTSGKVLCTFHLFVCLRIMDSR